MVLPSFRPPASDLRSYKDFFMQEKHYIDSLPLSTENQYDLVNIFRCRWKLTFICSCLVKERINCIWAETFVRNVYIISHCSFFAVIEWNLLFQALKLWKKRKKNLIVLVHTSILLYITIHIRYLTWQSYVDSRGNIEFVDSAFNMLVQRFHKLSICSAY